MLGGTRHRTVVLQVVGIDTATIGSIVICKIAANNTADIGVTGACAQHIGMVLATGDGGRTVDTSDDTTRVVVTGDGAGGFVHTIIHNDILISITEDTADIARSFRSENFAVVAAVADGGELVHVIDTGAAKSAGDTAHVVTGGGHLVVVGDIGDVDTVTKTHDTAHIVALSFHVTGTRAVGYGAVVHIAHKTACVTEAHDTACDGAVVHYGVAGIGEIRVDLRCIEHLTSDTAHIVTEALDGVTGHDTAGE